MIRFKAVRLYAYPFVLAFAAANGIPAYAEDGGIADLKHMSIEQLANIEVTSVSRRAEGISDAPAAIYVVTHRDVETQALSSLPDALRLAPILNIAQTSPRDFNISSRGLSGNVSAQNFPNKLLVLIDGRSVYSPLYSGVYWDMQQVMMNDLDRIEVISGPGATLWGSNAVNGVISVTSKNSGDTQGGVIDARGGNLGGGGVGRYGGRFSEDLTYRIYAGSFAQKSFSNPDGTTADDGWSSSQAGFRMDWKRQSDLVTVQGDLYRVDEDRVNNPVQRGRGANVLSRWQHEFSDGSSLQVQGYYDFVHRGAQGDAGSFNISTYDVELQHSFTAWEWNKIVWGIGERISPYTITDQIGPTTSLLFRPNSRTLSLTNVYIQDQISLAKSLDVTLGIKIEDDPYSGVSPMPSARIAWRPISNTMLWAAASRAIRAPTPFDTDVIERLGPADFLHATTDFQPEGLNAYEIGYRGVIANRISLSVAGYWDVYDHLRSIETEPGGFLPLRWGNGIEGKIYGFQAWADIPVFDWWRVSLGASRHRGELRFKPGSSGLLGLSQVGNGPRFRGLLRSLLNITETLTLDTDLRYMGHRPNPYLAAFVEADATISWRAQPNLDLYLSGRNLLHDSQVEYVPGDAIPRSVMAGVRWHF